MTNMRTPRAPRAPALHAPRALRAPRAPDSLRARRALRVATMRNMRSLMQRSLHSSLRRRWQPMKMPQFKVHDAEALDPSAGPRLQPLRAGKAWPSASSGRTEGGFKQARQHPEGCVRMEHVVHGDSDNAEAAKTLGILGLASLLEGDLKQARQHLEGCLRLEQVVHRAVDNPKLATTRGMPGGVIFHQGDLKQARRHLEECLRMQRLVHSDVDNIEVARTLGMLGQVSLHEADLKQARQHLEECLRVERVVYGDSDNVEVAKTLGMLGQVSLNEGDLKQARQRLEETSSKRGSIWRRLEAREAASGGVLGRGACGARCFSFLLSNFMMVCARRSPEERSAIALQRLKAKHQRLLWDGVGLRPQHRGRNFKVSAKDGIRDSDLRDAVNDGAEVYTPRRRLSSASTSASSPELDHPDNRNESIMHSADKTLAELEAAADAKAKEEQIVAAMDRIRQLEEAVQAEAESKKTLQEQLEKAQRAEHEAVRKHHLEVEVWRKMLGDQEESSSTSMAAVFATCLLLFLSVAPWYPAIPLLLVATCLGPSFKLGPFLNPEEWAEEEEEWAAWEEEQACSREPKVVGYKVEDFVFSHHEEDEL